MERVENYLEWMHAFLSSGEKGVSDKVIRDGRLLPIMLKASRLEDSVRKFTVNADTDGYDAHAWRLV